MRYKCRTCHKPVKPKDGKLKCCGIEEGLKECNARNRRYGRSVRVVLDEDLEDVLGPVEDKYFDDEDGL